MNTLTQAINKASIRTKKNGLIEARICYKGEQKSFYGHTAVEWKRKVKEYYENKDKEKEKVSNKSNQTLNEVMLNWLETYKSTSIEPSSYARLVTVFKNQIKPSFGKKIISEITADDVQKLINDHAKGTNGKKALAKSGLLRLKDLLNPCFKHAIKRGLISTNPCEELQIPTGSNIIVKTKEQFSLNDEEIIKFKAIAMTTTKVGNIKYRDYVILVIMIATGMRIGEMLVLEWSDINYEKNYIHVCKTLQTGLLGDEKYAIKDGTKTETKNGKKNERFIPMNENIKEYLELLKKFDKYHGINSKFVACTRAGTMNVPKNLGRSLSQLCKKAGLSDEITPHTLRHTFGSTLIRNKVGVEVVSRLMGHANIMVTYTKYIHVIKEQEAQTMILVTVI